MRMPPGEDVVVVPAPETTALAALETRPRPRIVVARRCDRGARRARPARPAGSRSPSSSIRERPDKARDRRGRDRGPGRAAGVPAARASLHRRAGAAAGRRSRAAARGARRSGDREGRARRQDGDRARSLDQSASRSRASSRTRCSPRSCSIRPPRPSPARRSRSGSAACCCRRARRSRAARKTSLEAVEVERAAPWAGAITHALLPIADAAAEAARGERARRRCIATSSCRSRGCSPRSSGSASTSTSRTSSKLGAEVAAKLAALERTIFEARRHASSTSARRSSSASCCSTSSGSTTKGVRRTKTGWSTEAETLEALIDAHPMIAPILEHREISKLKGTYLDALPPLVVAEDRAASTPRSTRSSPRPAGSRRRIRTSRTSRSAASSAMQIRRGFVAAPGHVLIAADYSQIELRILAHLSGDPKLGAAFRDKVDVHTQTAAEVFDVPREQVTAGAAPDRQGGQLRPVLRPVRLRPRAHARRSRARRPPSTRGATSSGSRRSTSSWTTSSRSRARRAARARCSGGGGRSRTSCRRARRRGTPPSASRRTRRCRAPAPTSSSSRCSRTQRAGSREEQLAGADAAHRARRARVRGAAGGSPRRSARCSRPRWRASTSSSVPLEVDIGIARQLGRRLIADHATARGELSRRAGGRARSAACRRSRAARPGARRG